MGFADLKFVQINKSVKLRCRFSIDIICLLIIWLAGPLIDLKDYDYRWPVSLVLRGRWGAMSINQSIEKKLARRLADIIADIYVGHSSSIFLDLF
jgi:hypothetical protein